MRIHNRLLIGAATVFAVAATTAAIFGPAASSWAAGYGDDEDTAHVKDGLEQVAAAADTAHLQLTPSSQQLAQCMPDADVQVNVKGG